MRSLATVLVAVVTGCAPALVHPMRVREGPVGEVGLTVAISAGRQANCYLGCVRGGSVVPVPIPYGTLAYGAVIDGHLGLLGGVAFPAGRVDGLDSNWDGDIAPRVFGLATLQDRWGSIGLGLDLHVVGIAWTVLVEARPGGDDLWTPAFGVFHRWFVPYAPREGRIYEHDDPGFAMPGEPATGYELGAIQPSFDLGTRITFGPLFVQWSVSCEIGDGLRAYQIPVEGQSYSQCRDLLTLGVSPDVLRNMVVQGRAAREAARARDAQR